MEEKGGGGGFERGKEKWKGKKGRGLGKGFFVVCGIWWFGGEFRGLEKVKLWERVRGWGEG